MSRSALDKMLTMAIATLDNRSRTVQPFDAAAYGRAFHASARQKAQDVLDLLSEEKRFICKTPVFVSVGGADGEELEYLLKGSNARVGILIEMVPRLAELARQRTISGKTLHVLEMSAQKGIAEAMNAAGSTCQNGHGDAIVVTCHAVIHELSDRGGQPFDLLSFFGNIFHHDYLPTWLTYREPGAPEKWPDAVLVSADCESKTLLSLVKAISNWHATFGALLPQPEALGDGVRVHKALGMELLHKLFYVEDLQHEIEERATSVNHRLLQNALFSAMGERARHEDRVSVASYSAPTKSFISKWQQLKVKVSQICEDCTTQALVIPEAQTRVVAWRMPPAPIKPIAEAMPSDITTAREALEHGEEGLLETLLLSRGRAWIESPARDRALEVLQDVTTKMDPSSTTSLWSRYLLSIAELFRGNFSALQVFERWAEIKHGALATLFRAEEMEFSRKAADLNRALGTANALRSSLLADEETASDLERYAVGTAYLLISNLLRSGGRYDDAHEFIAVAERFFRPTIPSHAAELAHCFYAKQVCTAMTGLASFSAPKTEASQKFAAALIQISYSHAAWFLGQLEQAKQHAAEAAELFLELGLPQYVGRAQRLGSLLGVWEALTRKTPPDFSLLDELLNKGLSALLGTDDDAFLQEWIPKLRPSTAVGLLQFSRRFSSNFKRKIKLRVPQMLETRQGSPWTWAAPITVHSLEDADLTLRAQIGIPNDRVIPLMAD